jgi:hypothetical protein
MLIPSEHIIYIAKKLQIDPNEKIFYVWKSGVYKKSYDDCPEIGIVKDNYLVCKQLKSPPIVGQKGRRRKKRIVSQFISLCKRKCKKRKSHGHYSNRCP